MRSDVFADDVFGDRYGDQRSARLRSSSSDVAAFASKARPAVAGAASEGWWSQTGSNRRPHACKARALPAELWPRTRRRMLLLRSPSLALRRSSLRSRRPAEPEAAEQRRLVGLGRLELPTSRLSSARSNQLSYKPLTLFLKKDRDLLTRNQQSCRPRRTSAALARVRPRRKRNEDGEIPPMELNDLAIVGP